MKLKTIEGILFLTYLTKYNISDIYSLIQKYQLRDDVISNLYNEGYKINNYDINKLKITSALAIEKLKYHSIKAIPYYSNDYPISLQNTKNPPPILFVKGNLKKNQILAAVVGSRKISEGGKLKTKALTKHLIKMGYGIVSGLALGVDSIAHFETIINNGYTISVLPNPLDNIYPIEHFRLANKILDSGGALVSELSFGINRGRRSFVERNRIQAALSDIVVPTEMGIKSGTMHTINFAYTQKKKIILSDFHNDPQEDNGIKFLVQKYMNNPSENIYIVRSLEEIEKKIGKKSDGQLSLFDEEE